MEEEEERAEIVVLPELLQTLLGSLLLLLLLLHLLFVTPPLILNSISLSRIRLKVVCCVLPRSLCESWRKRIRAALPIIQVSPIVVVRLRVRRPRPAAQRRSSATASTASRPLVRF